MHDWKLPWRVVRDGDVGLGESYVDGQWDCDDLTGLISLFHENPELTYSSTGRPSIVKRLALRLFHLSRSNRLGKSRENIASHYDLGDELYELFLDPTMSYSCAIYERSDESLEQAQRNKIRSILDKARLRPDDHVLEIGTGWGALAVEAASRFGCRVTGLTLSENQLARARKRVAEHGLSDRVSIELLDYRRVQGQFDKIIAVEMIEAVGHEYLGTFFETCDKLLADDGLVVLQAITVPDQIYDGYRRGCDFLQKHIFPGGLAPSLSAMSEAMTRQSRFVVESVSNIADHYAPTLRAWADNCARHSHELARRGYDERFQRLWRYYLCYCEAGFATRTFGDLQMVLTRPGNRSLVPDALR